MDIYIAGRVTARERLRPVRDELNALGLRVSSTWLDVAEDYPLALTQLGEPERDLMEVGEADLFIIDTADESPTGGREFEMGYAYSRGIPCWLVGPPRHIFHNLAERRFTSWVEVLSDLRR